MPKLINDFIPQDGKHCITTALKQVFAFYNHPVSEEMLFGISSGLGFTYINLAHSPMVSGRSKIFEFEQKLAERLNITIKCKQPKDYTIAMAKTKTMIDNQHPVVIYVDMPYLSYLGLSEDSHFGGHAVVLFGYDDEKQVFYISDRDNHDHPIRTPNGDISHDYHLVTYPELEVARNSNYRPFPAKNKYLEFDFSNINTINSDIIAVAIQETCENMLNPPAQLLGLNGIMKFSKEVLKWKNFDDYKLKIAGTTNYFMISHDGGTGGGIFRKMYGEFLLEAACITKIQDFSKIGNNFIEIATEWDSVANLLWELSETGNSELLFEISQIVEQIYYKEKEQYLALQGIINTLLP